MCRTHTHKDIFPLSFSGFLSIFRKRKNTHTHAQKNSGNVLFSFFLLYSPLPSALTFIICLFVCFCFCFAEVICCSCIAVTKAIMQIKYRIPNAIEKCYFMRFVFTYIHHLCDGNTLRCKPVFTICLHTFFQ